MSGFRTYDDWKLATPPEYEEMGNTHEEEEPEQSEPAPVRLQLSRKRGFNLQAHSLAVNGLPAVNVSRPSKWGNPFTFANSDGVHPALRFACEVAPLLDLRDLEPLRGKNLACWCALDAECHADVLLELANPQTQKSPLTADQAGGGLRESQAR